MRASIWRSASTSASAQSRSIVVVAGRMVRVRRQASTNLRTRSSFDCARCASSRSRSPSSRAAPPEKDRNPYRRRSSAKMLVPGLGPHRVVGELVPNQVELASDEIHDGRRNKLARSQQAARVAEHAQLQREAQLVAGTPPGPDVLQVFVAQGVGGAAGPPRVAEGKTGPTSAGWSGRFSVPPASCSTKDAEEPAGGGRAVRPRPAQQSPPVASPAQARQLRPWPSAGRRRGADGPRVHVSHRPRCAPGRCPSGGVVAPGRRAGPRHGAGLPGGSCTPTAGACSGTTRKRRSGSSGPPRGTPTSSSNSGGCGSSS